MTKTCVRQLIVLGCLAIAALAALATLVTLSVSDASAQWTYLDNNADVRALVEYGDELWVGTNGGLLILDPVTGEISSKIVTGELLPGNSVRTLLKRSGGVIVGTDDGLVFLKKSGDGPLTAQSRGAFSDVRHVNFGVDETMYVSTNGRGVAQVEGRRTHWITTTDSLLDNKVYAVSAVDENAIYYATSLGLCAFRDSLWVSFQAGAGLPRGEVRDLILVDKRERVTGGFTPDFYVLVAGRGIYRFDGRRARRLSTTGLFAENDIAAMAVSARGAVWAAGRHGRIAKYEDGEWTRYGEGDPEIDRATWRAAHIGNDGEAFFGTAGGMIAVIENEEIRKISVPSILPSGHIGSMVGDKWGRVYVANGSQLISIKEDTLTISAENDFGSLFAIEISPGGVVWANSRWGLWHKEQDKWTEFVPDIDPNVQLFVSMAFDSTGNLWTGTHAGEIYRYDGQAWIRFADKGELTDRPIDGLIVDGLRRPWALSTSMGVFKFDGSNWERFDISLFDTAKIVDWTLDSLGRVAVVTADSIQVFDDKTGWEVLQTPDTKQVGNYRTIRFDPRPGKSYLGTSQGLVLLSDGEPKWIGPRDGLRGKDITSILVDSGGHLWVGFQKDGLSRILLENLW